ncbi:hypothetical protein F5Y14DRAFT_396788 [Nemania sp. NC0429]|nr:hypothetical protein F5Y14DRAFT_396788 [Nemania sp. NC0429]
MRLTISLITKPAREWIEYVIDGLTGQLTNETSVMADHIRRFYLLGINWLELVTMIGSSRLYTLDDGCSRDRRRPGGPATVFVTACWLLISIHHRGKNQIDEMRIADVAHYEKYLSRYYLP